jgi:hypothetical protein
MDAVDIDLAHLNGPRSVPKCPAQYPPRVRRQDAGDQPIASAATMDDRLTA